MTRKRRLLLGLGCIWPLFYVVAFLLVPLALRMPIHSAWAIPHAPISALRVVMFLIESATLCLVAGLVVFFVLHVLQAKHVDESERLPWTLLLVLANVLSLPVYWYVNVWRVKDHTDPAALAPSVIDRDG